MNEKILIISGASRGIGFASAQLFQREGWQVISMGRNPCPLSDTKNIIVDFLDKSWPDKANSQLQDLVPDAKKICLVHNSALYRKGSVRTATKIDFRDSFEVNVIAPLQLNQLLFSKMLAGSAIIYIASTLGEKAVAGVAPYVASKHALIGLMRSTCQDLFTSGIHTLAICPGATDTQMLREHAKNDPEVLSAFAKMNSFQRLLDCEEIARVLLSCAAQPALNGAVLHANLGQKEI